MQDLENAEIVCRSEDGSISEHWRSPAGHDKREREAWVRQNK